MIRSLLATCWCLLASAAFAHDTGFPHTHDPANDRPTLGQPAYGPPAYSRQFNQPNYGPTNYNPPRYAPPTFNSPAFAPQLAPNAVPQYSGGYGRRFRSSGFGSPSGYQLVPNTAPGGYGPPPRYGNQVLFAPQGSPGIPPGGSCGPGCTHNH